jgi:AhpD family alkylhydroperoxidase
MTPTVRIGVQLWPGGTPSWAAWRDAVRHAEDLGAGAIFGYDHFHRPAVRVTPGGPELLPVQPGVNNFEGYLGLSGALSRGVLSPATRERIALAVAQGNGCSYCLSAHSYLAAHVTHLDAGDIAAARNATSADPKTAAILAFAATVNDGRGTVTSGDLAAARAAGLSDEEIAEMIGHVALNVLTNYFNKAAGVAIDFPAAAA